MRIAVDVRTVTPVRSGVGNYVLSLVEKLCAESPEEEWFFLGQASNHEVLKGRLACDGFLTTRLSHESHPLGDLWEHFWLPRVLNRNRIDVLHGPATLIPLTHGHYASVVTIHDLVAFLYPDTIPFKYAKYMRWLLKRVVVSADRIISVSHNTKQDLVRVLGMDPGRISVVHEAPQPAFRPVKDPDVLRRTMNRYGIFGPFIYHVGNIEPRKNLVRLIKAFLLLDPALRRDVRLVITGQKGWLTGRLFREIGGMDLSDQVIFTGYVPHEDVPILMSAAEAFVFPSLYEGFGLPALEAMSCGTPVVTSNLSSLPEIVGDAAVLVDPGAEESIAHGITRVLSDADLRADLSRKGLEQAALFSWQRAARETLDVYRQVCREKGLA